MTAQRGLAVLALVLVIGAGVLYGLTAMNRGPFSVGSPPFASLTPGPTASPTTPPSVTATPSPTASPSQAGGAITGRFAYGSDFIPPVTVYAINANDQRVWFSVEFPGYGNPPRPTAQPGTAPGTYTLTGVAPGTTYWVVAYRNDGQKPDPGVYTRASECLRRTPSGPCPDTTPVLVTVTAGQTTRDIDIVSWYPESGLMPPPPPRPTPVPAPEGIVLPQGCFYVGAVVPPTSGGNSAPYWRFTCGGAPDSAQRVSAAITQQGWARCLPQPGIAEWWKGPTTTRVTPASNANDFPSLSQFARFVTNCP